VSLDSYSAIKTSVQAWLHSDDLTEMVPDFIRLAELRIYRKLRIRCMETALEDAIASGVVAVPSGYVELKYAYINGTPVGNLSKKDAEWIYYNYPTRSADGKPKYIARQADSFIFGPYPDSAYTVKGVYYKRLPALSANNETNWFTENAGDLLLYGALCEAAPYLVDDARIPVWEGKFGTLADRVQEEDDQEEFSGSPLATTVR
jgi:hypothetical protein